MTSQLRIYDIADGKMDDFVALFHAEVAPLRRDYGFEVAGPWVHVAANQFVWIVSYSGDLTWDEAVEVYVQSPERTSISIDPMTMIDAIDTRMLEGGLTGGRDVRSAARQ